MKSKNRGFTLIELLIVVAIIGLLASVVLIGLGGFRSTGRDARRSADLRQIQTALELYFARCGFYPGDLNCGNGSPTENANGSITKGGGLRDVLQNSDLGATIVIPNDPLNPSNDTDEQNYFFSVNDSGAGLIGSRYVLRAKLEDANSKLLDNDLNGDSPPGFMNINCNDNDPADRFYCIGI
ncbi:MAG: hypothetical protein COU08_03820 [Candidatus Harrisonbacteria bacterium CG10_big_fil_rev_8_21_14_0_10_42_17]|uniref:Type II secretion system protein GspG C-terminal domain-containing protein n=1 Tax=Candidatus Harrisonbacteria bacterium CG10_big_fil_rev_8_21_14_0_10_42_17 TaxID=1974584 RepID=A0A2M6WHB8_9BACT|nr:MAG: hypothetical protein COU08_03820 [Candidatus Harrisonbacteria bacterium CG10_big_fil_rev_8_21_14_0_10_42_17]